MSCLCVNATQWVKVNKQTDGGVGGDRRAYPSGLDGFKDGEDQSIGDPFWVNGDEFPSFALQFLSCSSQV